MRRSATIQNVKEDIHLYRTVFARWPAANDMDVIYSSIAAGSVALQESDCEIVATNLTTSERVI